MGSNFLELLRSLVSSWEALVKEFVFLDRFAILKEGEPLTQLDARAVVVKINVWSTSQFSCLKVLKAMGRLQSTLLNYWLITNPEIEATLWLSEHQFSNFYESLKKLCVLRKNELLSWTSKVNRKSIIFLILAFSTNFCPVKSDLSGNTV